MKHTNQEMSLSAGIAWSKGVSKSKGPYLVQCSSCGRYVFEADRAEHRATCSPLVRAYEAKSETGSHVQLIKSKPELQKPRSGSSSNQKPSFMSQFETIMHEAGGAEMVVLSRLPPTAKRAFKLGFKVMTAVSEIRIKHHQALSDGGRMSAIHAIEKIMANLSDDVARGVMYLLKEENWEPGGHNTPKHPVSPIRGKVSENR